jgi:hypothetical protein
MKPNQNHLSCHDYAAIAAFLRTAVVCYVAVAVFLCATVLCYAAVALFLCTAVLCYAAAAVHCVTVAEFHDSSAYPPCDRF